MLLLAWVIGSVNDVEIPLLFQCLLDFIIIKRIIHNTSELFVNLFLLSSNVVFFPFPGGALKPTDVESLWVHVTCAWFQPEVSFSSDEKMEPAVGILRIPSNSFVKVD